MEQRTKITHKFDPVGDDKVPAKYNLVRTTDREARRSSRELWRLDTSVTPYTERDVLATFTRRQLSELIADGVDWLAYSGDEE